VNRLPSNNQPVNPQAKQFLNNLKYQAASEVGVTLREGYNGDLPARQAGAIGGHMVKRMIEFAQQNMSQNFR
jgi:hypothetical protein